MPGVPPCGLKCRINKATTYVKETLQESKKGILVYSIFFILLGEIISYFFRYEKNYACKIYPMISQLELFLLVFSLYLWNERLRFCFRKILATLFLAIYFLFGFFSLLLNLTDSSYTTIISCGLLAIASLIFIASLFNKSE
jgi:hypothetical protein